LGLFFVPVAIFRLPAFAQGRVCADDVAKFCQGVRAGKGSLCSALRNISPNFHPHDTDGGPLLGRPPWDCWCGAHHLKTRRSPQALLHPAAPVLWWPRPARSHHGPLHRASGWGERAAPAAEGGSRTRAQGYGPLAGGSGRRGRLDLDLGPGAPTSAPKNRCPLSSGMRCR
jgi:hypothetical protein